MRYVCTACACTSHTNEVHMYCLCRNPLAHEVSFCALCVDILPTCLFPVTPWLLSKSLGSAACCRGTLVEHPIHQSKTQVSNQPVL
jgi:hypothetical protein